MTLEPEHQDILLGAIRQVLDDPRDEAFKCAHDQLFELSASTVRDIAEALPFIFDTFYLDTCHGEEFRHLSA